MCVTGWACEQYWEILCRVREKYYPEKAMRVRRSLFVGRRNLDLTGMAITGETAYLTVARRITLSEGASCNFRR